MKHKLFKTINGVVKKKCILRYLNGILHVVLMPLRRTYFLGRSCAPTIVSAERADKKSA